MTRLRPRLRLRQKTGFPVHAEHLPTADGGLRVRLRWKSRVLAGGAAVRSGGGVEPEAQPPQSPIARVRLRRKARVPASPAGRPIDIDWGHPGIPASIRRPWQVWEDEYVGDADSAGSGIDGCMRHGFSRASDSEQAACASVSRAELAAFVAWLSAQASGRCSPIALLSDVQRRPGLWGTVQTAWDELLPDDKGDWLPVDPDRFLLEAVGGAFALPTGAST